MSDDSRRLRDSLERKGEYSPVRLQESQPNKRNTRPSYEGIGGDCGLLGSRASSPSQERSVHELRQANRRGSDANFFSFI